MSRYRGAHITATIARSIYSKDRTKTNRDLRRTASAITVFVYAGAVNYDCMINNYCTIVRIVCVAAHTHMHAPVVTYRRTVLPYDRSRARNTERAPSAVKRHKVK